MPSRHSTSLAGHIYFIRAGEHGPIKIGYTTASPAQRLEGLQVGSSEPLSLVASFSPATESDEAAIHRRHAAARLRGEWFSPAPEVLATASTCSLGRPDWLGPYVPSAAKENRVFRAVRDLAMADWTPSEIAEVLKVHLATVYRHIKAAEHIARRDSGVDLEAG